MAAESGGDRAPSSGAGSSAQPHSSLRDPGFAELTPTAAWSRRVRRVGGLIQTAFAAYWLIRGAHAIGGSVGTLMIALSGLAAVASFAYAMRVAAGTAARPRSVEGRRIERAVTLATVIELVAAFVFPIIVSAAGHSDWVLPSIAITIGPLLLYLGHLVQIPRYRPVGWVLTVGPVILVAALSGPALVATTGLAAGIILLGTAVAGFRDLATVRRENKKASAAILAGAASAKAPL